MGHSRAIAAVGMANHLTLLFTLGPAIRKENTCSLNSN
jgi:hypothetical protein